ncbi:hypothetical protein A2U01_0075306, partial [Trifolium medium]|nr:hypothetical protein [Trifolium medium]
MDKKRTSSKNHNQLQAIPPPRNVPSALLCHRELPAPCA